MKADQDRNTEILAEARIRDRLGFDDMGVAAVTTDQVRADSSWFRIA